MPTATIDPTILTFIERCLGSRWDPALGERAASQAAEGAVDWERVLEASYVSRTTALLYDAVGEAGWVDAAVRARLRQVYLRAAVRHIRLTHAYGALLGALNDAGVAHLVFKGPVLAELVYRNAALRPYSDLDVLIHREDLARAQGVLAELGYAQRAGELRPGHREAFGSEQPWGKDAGDLALHIDLHWKPVGKIYGEMRWLWAQTAPWAMGGAATRAFEPSARLLYLAAHLALHHGHFARAQVLHLLYDIAWIANEPDCAPDWTETLALAEAHRLALPLRYALREAGATWPLAIPDEAARRLEQARASHADARAVALMTRESQGRLDTSGKFWVSVGRAPSWRARLGILQTHLFPTWAYMAERYETRGPVHTALAYPYRWLYGLTSLVRTAARVVVSRL